MKSFLKLKLILAVLAIAVIVPACLYMPDPFRANHAAALRKPPVPTDRNVMVTMKGIAFHDYNGNGIKEYIEPIIPGLEFDLYDKEVERRLEVKTDSSGAYSILLPSSTYYLLVDSNVTGVNGQPFRYLYISEYEVRGTDEAISVTIAGDMTNDLALMQGFLTLPFSIVMGSYINTVYFDVDKREDFYRDWQGGQETYDQHTGIDFRIPAGTPVLASAPGEVLSSRYDRQSGNVVAIVHGIMITQYGHLGERSVRAGDLVARGQKIGLSGATGEWVGKFPHVHIDLSEPLFPRIDIFRDITGQGSPGYWTVDNRPQYP